MTSGLRVLVAASSIAFMVYCTRYAYSMMMPYMMQDLGLNYAQAGLIYSSYMSIYLVAALFIGFLVDVRDLRLVILTFLPLFAVGNALMAAASSLWTASLFFGIAGLGASVGWVPTTLWVQRRFPERRGTYLGILQLSCNLGFGTLGLLLPVALPVLGWRGVWMVLGVISAVWLIPITAMTKGATAPVRSDMSITRYLAEFRSVLRNRAFWLGGGSYMAASFAIMTPLTFSADYVKYLGIGEVWESMVFTVIAFVGIAGALVIPPLSDRIGREKALALNNTIMMVGLAGSAIARSFLSLIIWTVAVGVSYGGVWVLYAALVRDIYGSGVAGGVMGAWTLIGGLGLLLSPFVGGLLIDILGGYTAPYLLSAALAIISIPLAFMAKKLGPGRTR